MADDEKIAQLSEVDLYAPFDSAQKNRTAGLYAQVSVGWALHTIPPEKLFQKLGIKTYSP